MNIDEAITLVRSKWDEQGACQSCGWHAALYEYGPLEESIDIMENRVEMSCLNENWEGYSHRGVRIYFTQPVSADGSL